MIVIAVCFEFLLHVLHVLLIAVVYPLVYLKKCYDGNSFVLQLVNWARSEERRVGKECSW